MNTPAPLQPNVAAATAATGNSNSISGATEKSTFSILIIAKNPEVEGLMQTLLKASGFECQFAPQGGLGLTMFETNPADLVLISTDLPDRNGFEVCLKLREKSTVPVLMVTTKRSTEEEFRGLKVGADAYLEEPFNSRLVMAHIVAQLRRTYKYDGQSKNSENAQDESQNGHARARRLGELRSVPLYGAANPVSKGQQRRRCGTDLPKLRRRTTRLLSRSAKSNSQRLKRLSKRLLAQLFQRLTLLHEAIPQRER